MLKGIEKQPMQYSISNNSRLKKRALIKPNNNEVFCTFPNREALEEWIAHERNVKAYVKKMFNTKERIVIFLSFICHCGILNIRKRTGIGRRQIERIRRDCRDQFKYTLEIEKL